MKNNLYMPVKDGIEKSVKSVEYFTSSPPYSLSHVVQSFWEIKTERVLPQNFVYHVVPDACVNILFNQLDTKIAGVTALQTTPLDLNLGNFFHYVGIQFIPGVWRGSPSELIMGAVTMNYLGNLKLFETNRDLFGQCFSAQCKVLSELVERFLEEKLVVPNKVTKEILRNINDIRNVTDMAEITNLSPRQLQRTLKQTVYLAPHDFLKILRVQQSFKQDHLLHFADQSHFIHSFRKITGYTPTKYTKKFDV